MIILVLILDECQQKVVLYMGYIVRVINQRQCIEKGINGIGKNKNKKRYWIVMDYKIKMVPVYFREKTLEHFGKKGMSWHGAMVYKYQGDELLSIDPLNGSNNKELEELMITYYDYISSGDLKQDL